MEKPDPGPERVGPFGVDWSDLDGSVLDEYILGAPREFTRSEVAGMAGQDTEQAHRLWRALGFPDLGDDERVFSRIDVEAAQTVTRLSERWLPDAAVREAVARAVAQSMSRLAEWQVGMLAQVVAANVGALSPREAASLAAEVLPDLERLQSYVWRRHLAAVASRWIADVPNADPSGRPAGRGERSGPGGYLPGHGPGRPRGPRHPRGRPALRAAPAPGPAHPRLLAPEGLGAARGTRGLT